MRAVMTAIMPKPLWSKRWAKACKNGVRRLARMAGIYRATRREALPVLESWGFLRIEVPDSGWAGLRPAKATS